MKNKLLVVLFNCLALSALASPETHRAQAEELWRINSNNQDISKLFESKISDMSKKLAAKGAPKEAVAEIQEVTRKFIYAHANPKVLESKIIDRLVAKFSEEEISKLIAMVKDPLFQRMKDEMVNLKKETLDELDAAMKDDSADLKEALQAIVKKYKLK